MRPTIGTVQNNATQKMGQQQQQWMQDYYGDPRTFQGGQGGLLDIFQNMQLAAGNPQQFNRQQAQNTFANWNPFISVGGTSSGAALQGVNGPRQNGSDIFNQRY